jgi:hypothetical protein
MAVEILVPPHVKVTNVHCSWTDDVRVIQMPVEEMCLEDVPTIEVDLGETRD